MIIVIVFIVLTYFFAFSLCRAAKRGDECIDGLMRDEERIRRA